MKENLCDSATCISNIDIELQIEFFKCKTKHLQGTSHTASPDLHLDDGLSISISYGNGSSDPQMERALAGYLDQAEEGLVPGTLPHLTVIRLAGKQKTY